MAASSRGIDQQGRARWYAGDLRGPAVAGRDHRHPGGGGLDQRQAERLVQRRVHEHAANGSPLIQRGDVRRIMPRRQRHASAQIFVSTNLCKFADDLPLLHRRVAAAMLTGEDDKIGLFAQCRCRCIGAHQRGKVFLADRTRDRQHDGLVRVLQLAGQDVEKRHVRVRLLTVRYAWGEAVGACRCIGDAIGLDLPIGFIAGRHDDGIRPSDGSPFGCNASVQTIAAGLLGQLVDPKCVRRIDDGNVEALAGCQGHGGGIGEMGMDDVGQARQRRQVNAKCGGESGQVDGQRLFFQIAPPGRGNAIYGDLVAQWLRQ